MKKSFFTLLLATAVFSIGAVFAHAGEILSQAVVLKVTGDAQVSADGKSQSVAIKAGQKLSQGAVITTMGSESEVDLQPMNGVRSIIKGPSQVALEKLSVTSADGVVTKQTAILDLKAGTLLSAINPASHKINDYTVHTPYGVIKDAGTAYSAGVTLPASVGVTPPLNPGLYVQVLAGMINVTNGAGAQNFSVGQFGFTPSFQQPPVIIPQNPGIQFTPPPSFSSSFSSSALQSAYNDVTNGNSSGNTTGSNTPGNTPGSNSTSGLPTVDPSIGNNNTTGNSTTQSPSS